MEMFVIYFNPSDFVGCMVIRRFSICGDGAILPDEQAWYVHSAADRSRECLEDVRQHIPSGLTCIKRSLYDDPVIVETWV
ncbi:hypothetical protein HED60_15085 [Planctomycetales bacterium ZRK34]|nr:hypothetical protein HED60_15085 [Planctomycetales bacterium ZRK34]